MKVLWAQQKDQTIQQLNEQLIIFIINISNSVSSPNHNLQIKKLYLSIFTDVVEEFSSWHIFHYHEDVGWCADDLVTAKQTKCTNLWRIHVFASVDTAKCIWTMKTEL